MSLNEKGKIGFTAVLTAQQYLAGIIFEIPVYSFQKYEELTFLGAYAFQSSGDGNKNLSSLQIII